MPCFEVINRTTRTVDNVYSIHAANSDVARRRGQDSDGDLVDIRDRRTSYSIQAVRPIVDCHCDRCYDERPENNPAINPPGWEDLV